MRLAQHCDLAGLVAEHLKMTVAVGANVGSAADARAKVAEAISIVITRFMMNSCIFAGC